MRFKKGDKVVYIGPNTGYISKGNTYAVIDVNPEYGDVIEIVDESGELDIYYEQYFEHDKNRIVKDILEDL